MTNNLVRQGSLLGGTKNIIGNKYSDLVLETLGKVYIKTGNSSRVLNDVFKLLDKYNKEEDSDDQSKTLIVESISDIDYPGDGVLIFDINKKALYIAYDQRYILLIDSLEYVDDTKGYVKRSGDTMTGTLTIKTQGAPLIVASKELVKNLNAEYLGGHSASRFAVKILNEKIYGEWSFQKETTFNGVTKFNNKAVHTDNVVLDNADIITTGSIGSPVFASGYNGYGWRFDAKTQMLTVDYLVVRKAMQVFELIVNQIKATNGALWVTDSCEVNEVFEVHYLDITKDLGNIVTDRWYLPFNGSLGTQFLEGGNVKAQYISSKNLSGPGLNDLGPDKTFYNYNYLINFSKIPTGLTKESFNDTSNFGEECNLIHVFDENNVSESTVSQEQLESNTMYNLQKTPCFYSTNKQNEFDLIDVRQIYSYYKYFGIEAEFLDEEPNPISNKMFIIKMKEDTYPTFREGDIVRCQKFEDNNIRYYDALIGTNFDTYYYVVIVADSVFDKSTTIEYDNLGNLKSLSEVYNSHQYDKTSQIDSELIDDFESNSGDFYNDFEDQYSTPIDMTTNPNVVLTTIQPKDGLVRIGNLYKKDRQNSVFITSSEEYSPYVQTMSGVDRPDYSVIYTTPKFKTIRKIINGVITDLYYSISDEPPTNGELYDEKWIIDDTSEDIYGQYITTENSDLFIFLQQEGEDDQFDYAIQLEHNYRKIFYVYHEKPNINCEIEKNEQTDKFKATYSNHIKARFGRLDGIYHELFGDKQPYGYGLYGDNVFLTGEFFLSNGQAVANIGKDIKFEINNEFGNAGLYIKSDGGKPYIVLSAEQIKILTSNGIQTALFVNGRIESSLIRVSDLEAAEYYKYYAAEALVDSDGNYILDANNNYTYGEYQAYSFKYETGVENAMVSNGHSLEDYRYSIKLDENYNIYTDVDTDHPHVIIDANTGTLTANSANLTGGKLELYSADGNVQVVISANGDTHSGMDVNRKSDSGDWIPVAHFNGDIIEDPYKLYKSESVYIDYVGSVSNNERYSDKYPGGNYNIRYNKQSNSSYIQQESDEFGFSPNGYNRDHYYPLTNSTISLSRSTDIKITGTYALDLYLDQYYHLFGSVNFNIVYKKVGAMYYYPFGPYYSASENFDFYGNAQKWGTGTKNFSVTQTLQPGNYDFFVHINFEMDLSNKWYDSNEGYFSNMEIPTTNMLYGPDYTSSITINSFEALSNQFVTRYFGNGFTSGFNEQNYFSVYNSQGNNPAMVVDFQANGAGMMYKEGISYQYFNGYQLRLPIPIYSAHICVGTRHSDSGGQNYSQKSHNTLGYSYPIVMSYKRWLWEVNNSSIPADHVRSKMYATGRTDSDEPQTHGDFVIDFQGLDAYQNIDFSSDQILVCITGSPRYGVDGEKETSHMYGTLYSKSDKQIRIWLQDDASNNDGDCYVIIYYIPA